MVYVNNFRITIYDPLGARKGIITDPQEWSASLPFNDAGAFTLKMINASPEIRLLDGSCEAAIEYWDANVNGWVEPVNARFVLVERATDSAAGKAGVTDFTFRSYASLFEGIPVMPRKLTGGDSDAYDSEGKRKFLSCTPGRLLNLIIQDAVRVVPNVSKALSKGFGDNTDSDGRAWKKRLTVSLAPGITVLGVLQNLAGKGLIDWCVEGRVLKVRNAALGDRTSVHIGEESEQAPQRSTIGGIINTAILVGDEGKAWKIDNASSTPAPWGPRVKVLNQGGVSEESTARTLVNAELEAGSRERREHMWQADATSLNWVLFRDLPLGDWVWLHTGGGFEAMRVYQISLAYDGGSVKVTLTLNDRFEDAQVRLAKKINGIVNGASGDAGVGSLPARPEKAEPRAPVGLVVESDGYWDADQPESSIRVGFSPVTLDVHGLPIEVAYYEVNAGGKVITTKNTYGIEIEGFTPGKTVTVQVRAVSAGGVRSETALANVVTEFPLGLLAPPTRLTVTCSHGMVDISWDGKLQEPDGRGPLHVPPAYFSHLRIEESMDARSWKTVGDIRAGGIVLDRQAMLGATLYYQAIAVGKRGQESMSSDVSSVKVVSVISDAINRVLGDVSRIESRKITSTMIADGAITTPKLAANSVNAAKIVAGSIGAREITVSSALVDKIMTNSLMAGRVTAKMFSTDAGFNGEGVTINRYGVTIRPSGNASEAVIVLNAKHGFFVNDSTGRTTVRIDKTGTASFKGDITSGSNITGATIRTSTSGTRIEISSDTLYAYDYQDKLTFRLNDSGMSFWYGARKIGAIGENHKEGYPDVRGLHMNLENQGDYVAWGWRKTPEATSYTSLLTLDPKGKFHGAGEGIRIGAPIICARSSTYDPANGSWQRLEFTATKLSQWYFPALMHIHGRSGIAFSPDEVYLVRAGKYYPLGQMLRGDKWNIT